MDFYTSKPKLLFLQILFTLLTILLLMTFRTTSGIVLSLLLIFLIIKTLPDLFTAEPVLRFDHNGIQTSNKRNNRFGLFLWTDIVDIRVTSFKLSPLLAIKVKNPEEYQARVKSDKGTLLAPLFHDPAPYITLSFALLTPSLDEALKYIKSNHPSKLAG
jgi:hypothetical protein